MNQFSPEEREPESEEPSYRNPYEELAESEAIREAADAESEANLNPLIVGGYCRRFLNAHGEHPEAWQLLRELAQAARWKIEEKDFYGDCMKVLADAWHSKNSTSGECLEELIAVAAKHERYELAATLKSHLE